MRKYFEYEFNDTIKKDLLDYYNSPDKHNKMHGVHHQRKMALKLERACKHLEINSGDVILDIGCSEGELLNMLADKVKRGLGLDLSSTVIENNISNNIHGNIEYKKFDGASIPLQEKFNKIFLLDVLEHAFFPDELIKSIYEKLQGGGRFVIQVPTTGWLSELIFGKYHFGHLRYYDEDYLGKYLEKFGFHVVHKETFNSVPFASFFLKYKFCYKILDNICKIIPHRLFPYYGAVMIIAEKRE